MKTRAKSLLAALLLLLITALAVWGLPAMTRAIRRKAYANAVIVTASPAPDYDEEGIYEG